MGCQDVAGSVESDDLKKGYPSASSAKAKPGAAGKSKSKKKAPAQAATKEAPPPPVFEDKDRPETATEKRIRALRKKIREIDALQEKVESTGCSLTPEMEAKLAGRQDLERQVEQLKQVAAFEQREAAAIAAEEAKAAAERAAAEEAAAAKASAEAEAAAIKAAEKKAAAEAALAQKRRKALDVIADVAPNGEAARNDARLRELLKQVVALSEDIFHENPLTGGEGGVSKKSGWRLTLLARPIPEDPLNAPPEDPSQLLGFMVYRLRPDFQCLSIAKIAVPEEHRGRGFGRHLMDWVTKYAKQQANLLYLSLSSLPEAVKFYQNFGFKEVKVSAVREDNSELVEGQVYMEYRLKGAKKTSKQ